MIKISSFQQKLDFFVLRFCYWGKILYKSTIIICKTKKLLYSTFGRWYHCLSLEILSGSEAMPFVGITWPRKTTLCCRNWHLCGCTFELACFCHSKTWCKLFKWLSKLLPKMTIPSGNWSTETLKSSALEGGWALHELYGITLNSDKASWTWCSPTTSTCQCPLLRSTVNCKPCRSC